MANRVSEPAPAPPPAAPVLPPAGPASTRSPAAQKMGIPDFGQETADPAPVAIAWDDYDANDGGGMPAGDRPDGVNMEGTDRPEAGRPTKGKKTTVNVAGTDAEVDPDVHLDAHVAVGDEEGIVPKPQPGESQDEEAPAVARPNASERRRAALEALAKEQQRRSIEESLISERQQREALEKKLKSATLGELLAMRGLNRDDALETMIAGKENEGSEAQLTPEQRELAAQRAELDAIKKEREAERAELAKAQRANYFAKVAEIVTGHEPVPVVHAALKSNAIVDHDENGAPLRAAEWIAGLASAEWEKAGSVAGKQKAYLATAAEVLEDFLIEQHDPIVKAIATKRNPPAERREVAPPRPPSLRKPAPRPEARPAPLPRDRDQLDIELKKRFRLL